MVCHVTMSLFPACCGTSVTRLFCTLTLTDGNCFYSLPAGIPSLSGTGTVTVLVNDVNDNTPVFTSSTFHTTITEDAPTGTDVLLVNSSDADVGVNGVIR